MIAESLAYHQYSYIAAMVDEIETEGASFVCRSDEVSHWLCGLFPSLKELTGVSVAFKIILEPATSNPTEKLSDNDERLIKSDVKKYFADLRKSRQYSKTERSSINANIRYSYMLAIHADSNNNHFWVSQQS